jgi:hypothetical protein
MLPTTLKGFWGTLTSLSLIARAPHNAGWR